MLSSSRQRGNTTESDESFNKSLTESPFLSLIPLEEARKISATRRAHGSDENACPILKAHGAAAKHAIRNISTASNAGSVTTPNPAVAMPPVSRFVPRPIANGREIGTSLQVYDSAYCLLTLLKNREP